MLGLGSTRQVNNITCISKGMADIGVALNWAKTQNIRPKVQALNVVINSEVLTDCIANKDAMDKDFEKITVQSSAEEKLAKIKSEKERRGSKRSMNLGNEKSQVKRQGGDY